MAAKRVAVVTGSNKGIGFGISKLLASKGVLVVLTARDYKKGNEALEKFKDYGLSDNVVFHQLDVADSASISSLADFIKSKFGKLDILVNNAGVVGAMVNPDAYKDIEKRGGWPDPGHIKESYGLSVDCIQTNYYGSKRMIKAFVPLLRLSDSPRIVNVTSSGGKLMYLGNEWAKGILRDTDSLTEDRIEEVLNEFLKDFKENNLQAKGWPLSVPAYAVSKAALNAYTRIAATKYPDLKINAVCPGYVKTDANHNTGTVSIKEGSQGPVMLALLPEGGPSGKFFYLTEETSFE